MTQRPFVNIDDMELLPQSPQKPEAGFGARFAPIAAPLGATKLGRAGVNIQYIYAGSAGSARKLNAYMGVSDLKAALKAAR